MKLEFSRQFLKKYSNINFHKNPSTWSRVVPCGRTDRHDEANSCYSQAFFQKAIKFLWKDIGPPPCQLSQGKHRTKRWHTRGCRSSDLEWSFQFSNDAAIISIYYWTTT